MEKTQKERVEEKDQEIMTFLKSSSIKPGQRFSSNELSLLMGRITPSGNQGDGRFTGKSLSRLVRAGFLVEEKVYGKYGAMIGKVFYYPYGK